MSSPLYKAGTFYFMKKRLFFMLTLDKVFDASNVLKEVIRPTACIYAPKVNPDCNVYLKTENLQVTGSFKVRGAYYKISQLSADEKAHGVIACSAGNHAQGVALAATKNGIKSIICLPDGAPISKVEATKGYAVDERRFSHARIARKQCYLSFQCRYCFWFSEPVLFLKVLLKSQNRIQCC